jgi:hypothetical protein
MANQTTSFHSILPAANDTTQQVRSKIEPSTKTQPTIIQKSSQQSVHYARHEFMVIVIFSSRFFSIVFNSADFLLLAQVAALIIHTILSTNCTDP